MILDEAAICCTSDSTFFHVDKQSEMNISHADLSTQELPVCKVLV